MRLLGTLIVVLALLLPASAQAQSVKMADLAGTWAETSRTVREVTIHGDTLYAHSDTIVIRSDSTYRWANDKAVWPFYRFTGDSLFFTKQHKGCKVALKDQQLTLTCPDLSNAAGEKIKDEFVGKRVDAPKPTP